MNSYEEKLKTYLKEHQIQAEHLSFNQSCHSVAEAAVVVGALAEDFVKSICMIDLEGNFIVAIVKGEDKASTTNVAKVLNIKERPRTAKPDEMLEKTGYPYGGTPVCGYSAIFLIDERVMEKEIVYSGGGSETSLLKIPTQELVKANNGKIVKIRK